MSASVSRSAACTLRKLRRVANSIAMAARKPRSAKPAEKHRGGGRRSAAKKPAGGPSTTEKKAEGATSQELIRAAKKLFGDHPPEDERPVEHRKGWIRGRLSSEKKAEAIHYTLHHNLASINGLREFYNQALPAVGLNMCLRVPGVQPLVAESAVARVTAILEQMQPRDAIEGMLIRQLIVTDARILTLSIEAADQIEADTFRTMNDALIATGNLFRRQVAALTAYKQAAAGVVKPIQQTNIAGQMLVNNFSPNELGSKDGAQSEKALPPVAERPAIDAPADHGAAAVAQIDRPAKCGGEAAKLDERP
jgi:hypothetical protein